MNGFSTDKPYITASTAQTFASGLSGFSQTLSANNQGSVSFQLSTDNGATWRYWNGTAWTNTTQTDGTETSSAMVINTNIAILDTDGGDFLWRGYLNSNGSQRVELDQVLASYALNLGITSAHYDATTNQLTVSGYGLESITGSANDIDASTLTLTGQGGASYTLTDSTDVEITSATEFTLTLSATDRTRVEGLLNQQGTNAVDGTAFSLSATAGF